MITAENITMHEIIGMNVEIVKSTNPQVIGINGRITDETKSMITIKTRKGTKMIAKSTSDWKFSIDNNSVIVKGTGIARRSFDRLRGKK